MLMTAVVLATLAAAGADQPDAPPPPVTHELIPNQGQWDDGSLFRGQTSAGAFFVTQDGFAVDFGGDVADDGDTQQRVQLHVHFVGASTPLQVTGSTPGTDQYNFLIGDPSTWQTGVTGYATVTAVNV